MRLPLTRSALPRQSGEPPYSVLLIDWQMPVLNGIDTARHIRAMGLTPEPKTLLITAYAREEVFRAAATDGIDEVLVKPDQPVNAL